MQFKLKGFFLLMLVCTFAKVEAQNTPDNSSQPKRVLKNKHSDGCAKWWKSTISLQAALPIGEFSITHGFGSGVDYTIEQHRENSFVYLMGNTGISYYFGKKETTSGYSYKYPGYIFIHVTGGAYFQVGDIRLIFLAGPALGIYNGNSKFNIAGKIEVNYSLKNEIMIGPLLNLMKEPGTTSLWSVGIRGTIVL